MDTAISLHMTSTQPRHGGLIAVCRCGWTSPTARASLNQARADGDAHLAEKNGASL